MSAPTLFEHRSSYPCSAQQLYDWHSRFGALERLLPPWEKTKIVSRQGGIDPGGKVVLKMRTGLFPFHFHAHHVENVPGKMFRDIQEKGPFTSWSHSHFFTDTTSGSTLYDKVEYSLPFEKKLPGFIKRHVHKSLQQVFHHRESIISEDIKVHLRCSGKPLTILISGASGVLGRELIPFLTTGGHQVWTLVRRAPDTQKNEIFWDPENDILDASQLPELDAVIHLAGEYIGLSRWSEEKKQRVISSRVEGTNLISRVISSLDVKPKVFLCASAVGYYGDTSQTDLQETQPQGSDFISEVCGRWEASAAAAEKAGIRTVFLRLGVGLTPRGGALERILETSPLGFMRRFGSGNQYISWISTDDMISAMLHCLACESLQGPVNIAAPEPVTNTQFMRTLAKVAKRPLLLPVPAALLKIVYGQMASEILLSGSHVSTKKLVDSGFQFRHPNLELALKKLLGKDSIRPSSSLNMENRSE
ncbi:MAG: hypothetical protein ACI8ZB_004858 [Desulforhopalus sp.]|jgi:uncharacterized protein (TIGR01777 family)